MRRFLNYITILIAILMFPILANAGEYSNYDPIEILLHYDNLCIISFNYHRDMMDTVDAYGNPIPESSSNWATIRIEQCLKGNINETTYTGQIFLTSIGVEPEPNTRFIVGMIKTTAEWLKRDGDYTIMHWIAVEKNGMFYNEFNYCYGNLSQINQIIAQDKSNILSQYESEKLFVISPKSNTYIYDDTGKNKKFVVSSNDALIAIGDPIKKNKKNWQRILLGEQEALVNVNFLKIDTKGKIERKQISNDALLGAVEKTAYIYQSADFKSARIAVARAGTCIAISEETNKFYKVITSTGIGYINKSHISKIYRLR